MKILETTILKGLCTHSDLYEVFLYSEGISVFMNGKIQDGGYEHEALVSIFSQAVNVDEWKHSWHIDINKFKNKDINNKILHIIEEKIKQREETLKHLEGVKRILKMQKTTEPEITNQLI